MKDNNVRKYIIVILLMLVVLVCGTTYALFTKTVNTEKVITIKTGKRYIGIYGPDKENLGLNVTYTFTIENRGVEEASYQVTIEDIINTVGRENINYTYTNGETTKTGKLSDGIIEEENLGVGEKVTVTIRLTSDLSGDYKGKIKVTTGEPINKNECVDVKSTPNPPELVGDMIPVVYNETTKNWKKADINGKWYDYEEQMWANAVTIKDQTKRAQYVAATAGTPILMEDMNTMMVWIPRYSYTIRNKYGCQLEGGDLPSQATPGAFDIKFVDKNTTDMGSGQYTGNTIQNYFTPSSFCWGDTCDTESTRKDSGNIELSGIWVSKFKMAGKLGDLTSLPNQMPLISYSNTLYLRLSVLFVNIKNGINGSNGTTLYGLSGDYDTHLLKNTEWGAFAYLSQSKYGKYGNKSFNGANKEIYFNGSGVTSHNSYDVKTGYSIGSAPTTDDNINNAYPYDALGEGTGASTTGTIYGIYDISGGCSECVMGNYGKYIGPYGTADSISHSGFNGYWGNHAGSNTSGVAFPSPRYYNLYNANIKYIKGDATMETVNFYNDYQEYPKSDSPWFTRGYIINIDNDDVPRTITGIFAAVGYPGSPGNCSRFSLVTW